MPINSIVALNTVVSLLRIYKDGKDVVADVKKIAPNSKKDQDFENLLAQYLVDSESAISKLRSFAYSGHRDIRDAIVNPTLIYKERLFNFSNQIQFEMIREKQFIVIDSAGMGKSTALKYLTTTLIESKNYIPLFMEVRKIRDNISIPEFIYNQIGGQSFNEENFSLLMKSGKAVLIFDGLDEIPLTIKNEVIGNIADFVKKNSDCRIIMSARPEDTNMVLDFLPKFHIKPLTVIEARELISKFDNNGKNSTLLISKLDENTAVREFLGNPLMVSLLFRAFDYRHTIPMKKASFYRQVYDSLFLDHDAQKEAYVREKRSKLEIDDFHKLTRALGFVTFVKGEIEFEKDAILQYIKEASKLCVDLKIKESDFLSDLAGAVPMFIKDGPTYRWSHKSLQEYFAAQYVCNDLGSKTGDFFKQLYDKAGNAYYRNFIDIIYDSNYNIFEEYFLYYFAKEALSYLQKNLSNNKNILSINEDDVEERLRHIYLNDIVALSYEPNQDDREQIGRLFDDLENSKAAIGDISGYSVYTSIANVALANKGHPKSWLIEMLMSKENRLVGYWEIDDLPISLPKIKNALLLEHNNKIILNTKKHYKSTNRLLRRLRLASLSFNECKKLIDETDQKKNQHEFYLK